MKPITRKEQIISAVAEGTTPIKPLTREELILAGEKIPPLTREEHFAEMMSAGGGKATYYEGTLREPLPIEVANAVWDKCYHADVESTPTMMAATYVVMGQNRYPLQYIAMGTGGFKVIQIGAIGTLEFGTNWTVGSLNLSYHLTDDDAEGHAIPLDHMGYFDAKALTMSKSGGDISTVDQSAVIALLLDSPVVTLVVEFDAPPTPNEGE